MEYFYVGMLSSVVTIVTIIIWKIIISKYFSKNRKVIKEIKNSKKFPSNTSNKKVWKTIFVSETKVVIKIYHLYEERDQLIDALYTENIVYAENYTFDFDKRIFLYTKGASSPIEENIQKALQRYV